MKRRPASLVARAVAAGALGLLPLALGGSARAAGTDSLGGWNISADGNGVDLIFDNATGLAGVHPFTEADFPAAQSSFQTGPFGSSLAAVFWPGSAGGNFGSLSAELGIPPQLQPVTSQLNHPARAATQFPAGPEAATFPAGAPSQAFEMRATSNETGSTAVSSISDAGAGMVLGFTSVKGSSSSVVNSAGRAVATASSDLNGVSILGLIDISSITSEATATSDGNKSSGSAMTHVGGVTVAGQPASIGSDGLILPDFAKSLGPVLGPLVGKYTNQVIADAGISIRLLPGVTTHNGAAFTAQSGSVQIQIVPPAGGVQALEQLEPVLQKVLPSQLGLVATLPGIFQGGKFTLTLGRAYVSTAASPPFNLSFTPPPLPPVLPSSVTPLPSVSAPVPTVPVDTTPPPSSPSPGTTPSIAPVTNGSAPAPAATTKPISLSSPLAAVAIVIGLLITGALGYGLFRVARMVLPEDAGPGCPLSQENQ